MKKIKNILLALAIMGAGAAAQYTYTRHNYTLLNDVESANYFTLEYKINVIEAQGRLINDLMSSPDAQRFVIDNELESYVKVSYLDYLEGNADAMSYEQFKEDFEF